MSDTTEVEAAAAFAKASGQDVILTVTPMGLWRGFTRSHTDGVWSGEADLAGTSVQEVVQKLCDRERATADDALLRSEQYHEALRAKIASLPL